MRIFMRLIAFLITVIAVLMLPFTLFGFQIGQILFSPEAMLNLIASEVIGPTQANIVAESLLQSLPAEWGIEPESPLGQALSTVAGQTSVLASLLPMNLQIEYAAQGLNDFYAWMDGPDAMPVVELDMQPLKIHLQQNASGLVDNVLNQLPPCTAAETLGLAGAFIDALLGGQPVLDALPSCIPAIISIETIAPAVGELLRGQISLIPDSVVLDNLVQSSPERMQEIKGNLQLTKGILQWSWLPLLFLLLIGALVGGQTRAGVPLWLGISLAVGGVLTFLLTLVPPSWWLAVTVPQMTEWPLVFQIPAVALLGLVYDQAGQSTVWLALALLLLGILFVILGFFLHRQEPKS